MENWHYRASKWLTYCTTSLVVVISVAMSAQNAKSGRFEGNISPKAHNAISATRSASNAVTPGLRSVKAMLPLTASSQVNSYWWPTSSDGAAGGSFTVVKTYFGMTLLVGVIPLVVALVAFGVLLVAELSRRTGMERQATWITGIEPYMNNNMSLSDIRRDRD